MMAGAGADPYMVAVDAATVSRLVDQGEAVTAQPHPSPQPHPQPLAV